MITKEQVHNEHMEFLSKESSFLSLTREYLIQQGWELKGWPQKWHKEGYENASSLDAYNIEWHKQEMGEWQE